ncbi:MAG: hypothetical protein FWH01_04175 [Oscillospiraceae bacterium]|nr:hypothetical protein [Oscillospiraceae bacterium]
MMQNVYHSNSNQILNVLPKVNEVVIPIEKLTGYALDPMKSGGKSIAFREALGYDKNNADLLINEIKRKLNKFPARQKDNKGYGYTYDVLMELVGVNGKTANVMTAWLDDEKTGKMRLTSVYVKKRKG